MKLTVEVDITPEGEYCGSCSAFVEYDGYSPICMLSILTEQPENDIELAFDKRKRDYKRTKYCKKVAP